MPVSWQMAPSPSAARSMFCAMIVSACADCVPAVFARHRHLHRRAHVGRQVGGRLDDERAARCRRMQEASGQYNLATVASVKRQASHGHSNRARSSRRARRPGRRVLRHPDGPRASRTSRSAACAPTPISSPPPSSSRRPRRRPTSRWAPRPRSRRRHRRARPTRCSAGAARSVRRRRLPGGRRHVAQHERQRGARQPRGGAARRRARRVHAACIPNDHVNMGQSTNDVFPTATRLALLLGIDAARGRGARRSRASLAGKADAFRRQS